MEQRVTSLLEVTVQGWALLRSDKCQMPPPKLSYKQDHMWKSLTWVLFNNCEVKKQKRGVGKKEGREGRETSGRIQSPHVDIICWSFFTLGFTAHLQHLRTSCGRVAAASEKQGEECETFINPCPTLALGWALWTFCAWRFLPSKLQMNSSSSSCWRMVKPIGAASAFSTHCRNKPHSAPGPCRAV